MAQNNLHSYRIMSRVVRGWVALRAVGLHERAKGSSCKARIFVCHGATHNEIIFYVSDIYHTHIARTQHISYTQTRHKSNGRR